jgi:hypothetical protein
MAARATLAFNLGEWVRLGRLAIYSLYFLAYEAYQNSREFTYRGVQICEASSDFNREALGIKVDFYLPSERVVRSLNQISLHHLLQQ